MTTTTMTTTTHTQSRLGALPIELLHHICSYLLPTHDPNRSILDTPPPSALLQLALTSQLFRTTVESYARTILLRWAPITKFSGTVPKSKRARSTHRSILLRWKKRHCVWCGRRSRRKAVLATGFGCCGECDRREWPDKITKTTAKKEFHLGEEHLFAEPGDGLPIINYGSYSVDGGSATMFLRADVERLARAVHGDWKAHMKGRNEKAAARRMKIAQRRGALGALIRGDAAAFVQGWEGLGGESSASVSEGSSAGSIGTSSALNTHERSLMHSGANSVVVDLTAEDGDGDEDEDEEDGEVEENE